MTCVWELISDLCLKYSTAWYAAYAMTDIRTRPIPSLRTSDLAGKILELRRPFELVDVISGDSTVLASSCFTSSISWYRELQLGHWKIPEFWWAMESLTSMITSHDLHRIYWEFMMRVVGWWSRRPYISHQGRYSWPLDPSNMVPSDWRCSGIVPPPPTALNVTARLACPNFSPTE